MKMCHKCKYIFNAGDEAYTVLKVLACPRCVKKVGGMENINRRLNDWELYIKTTKPKFQFPFMAEEYALMMWNW